jgi:hypothetical protein
VALATRLVTRSRFRDAWRSVSAILPQFHVRTCGVESRAHLTPAHQCSTFVLMEVETLGVARSLSWRVHMRCNNGYRQETRSMRKCVYRKQLDLETLVATRGLNFPLSRLESRLMCPACGNRRVTVVFEPPSNAQQIGCR